jgi:hypothetical protein
LADGKIGCPTSTRKELEEIANFSSRLPDGARRQFEGGTSTPGRCHAPGAKTVAQSAHFATGREKQNVDSEAHAEGVDRFAGS